MEDKSELFYNNDLKDFENLNISTPSIYDLGDYEVLIVLKDGTNITDWEDVGSLSDIVYISEDLSGVCNLSNHYYKKGIRIFSDSNPFKNLKAIVAQNLKSDVTSLDYMFYGLENLTTVSGLDSWDTSNVSNMKCLFAGCKNLTTISGIESFSIENAVNMNSMFYGCENLSDFSSLKSWDVEDVLDMDYMFAGCSIFNDLAPILGWNINGDCKFENMLRDCSIKNRMVFYSNWQKKLLNSFSDVFYDSSKIVGCINCGKFNMSHEDGHLICNNCGEILKDFPHICPDCGSGDLHFDFREMELVCKSCGLVIDSMDDEIPLLEEAYFNLLLEDNQGLKERLDSLDSVENQEVLYSFAMDDESIAVMKRACENLTSPDYLVKIALTHPIRYMRRIAYEKINDVGV